MQEVLWHATAGSPPVVPSPPVPGTVDVAVVGGGYCGLSAALELARRGRSVAVFERGAFGAGASTRNGGMVLPELKAGPSGPFQGAVEEAFDHVEALVTGPGAIDCDYVRSGRLELAHGPRGASELRRLADEHAAAGSPAKYVEGADLAGEIGSDVFAAGLVVERSGGLHPARLHAGLLGRAAGAEGVSLHAGVAVQAVDRRGVTTSAGRVEAGDVLLAVNAYADAAAPELRRRTLPMRSFIIATEPLTPEQQDAVLPTRRMVFDTRNLLSYWRLDADGRMVFGGRKGLGSTTVAEAALHLRQRLVRFHPQLAEVPTRWAWGGDVALTVDRMPHCGRLDGNAWYASGCNGSGVALMTWLGHRMAAAICGEPLPPFAGLRHRRVPFHGARRAWLPAVSAWFRLQDRRA